jgi:Peptidase U49
MPTPLVTSARLMSSSPVLELLRHIAGSPSAVAPELTPQLAAIATSNDLHIEFTTPAGQHLAVDTASGEIPFDVGFAEALWGLSYAFVVFPDMYQVRGEFFVDRGKGRSAARLFDFAKCLLLGRAGGWPQGTPTPRRRCSKTVRAANELFLAGTGWALLHEVGHVHLHHDEERPELEEEADAFASRWVLGWDNDGNIPPANYWKRCAGIALVLIAILGVEFFSRSRGGATHPDPVKRLKDFLQVFVDGYAGMDDEQKEQLWQAVAVMLYLFLFASKRNGELPSNVDARTLVGQMLGALG